MTPIAGRLGVCVWLCCVVAAGKALGAPVGMPEAPPGDAPADVRAAIADLYSDDEGTRDRAIRALREMGPRAAPAAPYLIPLCSSHGMAATSARLALTAIGKAAVPALVETLTGAETYILVAERASWALAGMTDREGQQALRDVMLDDTMGFRPRAQAARALATTRDEAHIPALTQLMKTERTFTSTAGESLACFGQPGVDALVGVLVGDGVDDDIRDSAARCMAKAKGCDVVAPLGRALTESTNPVVRLAAAVGLGGLKDERIPALLIGALTRDADARVRTAAATDLKTFLGRQVTDGLLAALRDDAAAEVRRAAGGALCDRVGQRLTAEDTPALAHVLDTDSDPRVLSRVAECLGSVGDRRAVEALCRVAIKELPPLMMADHYALVGLERLGDGRSVRWLMGTIARVDAASGFVTSAMLGPAWRASAALVACTGEEPWTATPQEEELTRRWRSWVPWWEEMKAIRGEEKTFVFTYEVGSEDAPAPRATRDPRRGGGISGNIDTEVRQPMADGEEAPAGQGGTGEAAEGTEAKATLRMQIAIRPVAQLDADEPWIELEVGEPQILEPVPELTFAQRGMLDIEIGMIVDKLTADTCRLLGHKRTIAKTLPYATLRAVLFTGPDMSFTLTRPAFTGGGD